MNRKTAGKEMDRKLFFMVLPAMCMFFLLLAGCAGTRGRSVAFDYYTLEYEPPLKGNMPVSGVLPVVLRLERFTAAPEYETDRMIYRDSANKRSAYYYDKWRAVPADLVTFFLKRDLSESGLFAGVMPPESGSGSTYVLDGTVEEFLEWDTDASCEARLAVSVVLLDTREIDATKQVLLQQRFAAREQCEERQPVFVAKAMSRSMEKVSRDVGIALQTVLMKNSQQ